jgi:hypothetical protein
MIEPYPHQEEVLSRLKNGSVLKGDTGSGKTLTALWYYLQAGEGRPLYVVTEAKKRDDGDWRDEMLAIDMWESIEMAKENVVVDSWQNIKKYVNISGAFFIFDEQHACGTGVWAKAFIRIAQRNKWIMCSATPGDKWEDYAAIFTAHGFYSSMANFKRSHVITKWNGHYPAFDRYFGEEVLARHRADVVVEMQGHDRIPSTTVDVYCEWDAIEYKRLLRERSRADGSGPFESPMELRNALRRACGEHPDRLIQLDKIVQRHMKAIVFYNFNWERDLLRTWAGIMNISCTEWSGHAHEAISESESWIYLVQYNAGSTAWNCIKTDCVVFFSLSCSYKQMVQARGRIDRINSPFKHLYYYKLVATSNLDRRIMDILDQKRDFQPTDFDEWLAGYIKEGEY